MLGVLAGDSLLAVVSRVQHRVVSPTVFLYAISQAIFPAGTNLGASNFLVVFASDKNRAISGSQLHTNFEITVDGEYLALVAADGSMVLHKYVDPTRFSLRMLPTASSNWEARGFPVNSVGTFGWVYTKESFAVLVSQINHADGLSTVKYRAAVPFDPVNVPSWFFRLAAELR